MLEKLQFRELVEELITVKRQPRSMSVFQFILAQALAIYVGFARLHHLQFVARDPMLTGVVQIGILPVQSTFWRFVAGLRIHISLQLLQVMWRMRERVWSAANVRLTQVTLDTDTTVHTLYGQQMGGRKEYNPKKRGKKSYQPFLTFIAETKEYVAGGVRNGYRPTGKEIARHLEQVFSGLPACVQRKRGRVDSGFYCWSAVQVYEKHQCEFMMSAKKTARLVEQLETARWEPSPRTDADEQCEFLYKPEGWTESYRFLALRYRKKEKPPAADQPVQYQLFDTPQYMYRAFVTNMKGAISTLIAFYDERGSAENLIKEANNDTGLTVHPYHRFEMNRAHFQLVMLAYNFNCWLMLFNREEGVGSAQMRHTTLATARLRFLFLAAKIWRHGRRVGVHYSDHYEDKDVFQRLMDRLRSIAMDAGHFAPVLNTVWS
jgi:Transposase DDE domain group 1